MIPTYDWRFAEPPITDQLSADACEGHAWTAYMAALVFLKTGKRIRFSPAWAWARARAYMGTFPQNVGVSTQAMMDALTGEGCCLESTMPWTPNPNPTFPEGVAVEAAQYKLVGPRYLANYTDLAAIEALLASGPCVATINEMPSLRYNLHNRTDGLIPLPESGEVSLGSHDWVLDGFDGTNGRWVARFSEGKSCGDLDNTNDYPTGPLNLGGYCYLAPGYEKFFTSITTADGVTMPPA